MRTIKKNVWKPFLFGCIGLVIATVVFASVRDPFEVASKPGPPIINSVYADRCSFGFEAPKNDGGTPIIHYLIESRELGSSMWLPKMTTHLLFCTVPGVEGTAEAFRVIAVNKAGNSEPSDPSKYIVFQK